MAKKIKITEEEIAQVTEILFKSLGYDIYPECQISSFGGRPDFIGVKGKHWCSAIECKTTLSYEVLAQVIRWHIEVDFCQKSEWFKKDPKPERLAIPNFLYVVTANSYSGRTSDLKKFLLEKYNIGWYDITIRDQLSKGWNLCDMGWDKRYPNREVDSCSDEKYGHIRIDDKVYEYRLATEAKIQAGSTRLSHLIVEQLYPEMKQATAGTTGGKTNYMTPFKLTMKRVHDFMEPDKLYTINDLLEGVRSKGDHHYSKDSTFKQSIGSHLVRMKLAEKVEDYPAKFKKLEKSDD